jgi:PAS domain S-box-containing protein
MVRDVTERRLQEQALYESEKRLELAIEGAALGLWDWNVQTGEHYVSQRWLTMLGYAPEDIEPNIRAWESLLHPEDREPTMHLLRTHFESELPYVAEFRLRTKSGDWVWICSRGKVVQCDAGGRPLRMLGIHLDMTRQKRAQLDLARAKEAAEAASRAKSNFLANMSHEIRTPMTAILGYLDVIAKGCPRHCDFSQIEVATYADVVVRNANLLMQILNDILDLSRIEANKLQIDRIACSPRQVLGEVIELLKIRADAKELQLSLDCEGPIPETILSDPIRLRQILINLVGNAIKFTESGGVRLAVRILATPDAEPQLEVRVSDSGIGMSPAQVEKLFQPFSQVDTSATRRFGGLGLGLVISRRLAMLLGGDITVESAPGKGSTFTLTVAAGSVTDRRPTDEPRSPAPARPEPSPSLACRILFVEDGPDNQRLIAYLLEKAGAEVTVAENGQVGLTCALASRDRAEPFDVILMDMQMPIMDGYEATRRLREQGWTGPIIALTAHAMKESRDECLEAGCDDYLTKPIDRQALVQTVAAQAARGKASVS